MVVRKDVPVPESRSDQMMASAIEANIVERCAYLGRWPRVEIHDDSDQLWAISDVHSTLFNQVARARFGRSDVEAAIEATLAPFAARNLTGYWWSGPNDDPPDLISHLGSMEDRGVSRFMHPGMAAELRSIDFDQPSVPGLAIRRVEDKGALDVWVQVAATSWELPPAFVPLYAEFCANQALGDGARWTLYFALLHGEPVGISSVFYGHATAGLYHVGVAPAARKQGIGTQITLAPLRDAAAAAGERGAYVATLFSSPGAINLYRRLGFREYCRIGQCLFGGPSTGDVRQLQQILSRLGYDTGAADGIYGSRTSAAVRAFQAEHTLAADGSPRAQVRRVLEAALAVERARAENGRQRAARR